MGPAWRRPQWAALSSPQAGEPSAQEAHVARLRASAFPTPAQRRVRNSVLGAPARPRGPVLAPGRRGRPWGGRHAVSPQQPRGGHSPRGWDLRWTQGRHGVRKRPRAALHCSLCPPLPCSAPRGGGGWKPQRSRRGRGLRGARRPALKPPVAAEDSVPAPDLGADSGRRVSVQRLLLTLVWLVPGDQEFNSRLADSPEVWLLAFGSRCELVSAPAERPVFGDFPTPLPAGGITAGFTLDSFPGLTQT